MIKEIPIMVGELNVTTLDSDHVAKLGRDTSSVDGRRLAEFPVLYVIWLWCACVCICVCVCVCVCLCVH